LHDLQIFIEEELFAEYFIELVIESKKQS